MPIERNGQTVGDITLNGNTIGEVTVNGTVVFTSGPEPGIVYYSIPDFSQPEIESFTLSPPFDLANKGSVDFTLSVSAGQPANMSISNDGLTFLVVDNEQDPVSNIVEKFELSTPLDLSTAQSQGSFAIPFENIGDVRTCFDFADEETRFYTNDGNGNMVQFDLSTPFDPTTGTQTGSIGPFDISGPGAPSFSPDGTKMAFGQRGGTTIRGGTLSTPFDISTFTQTDSFTTSENDPCSVRWNGDGTTLFVRHASPDMVEEYSTPNPYSINGLSFVQQLFVNPGFAANHEFNYSY